LREIGADAVPSLLILNKADRLEATEAESLLRKHGAQGAASAMLVSAHDANDVAKVRDAVLAFFEARMIEETLVIPYAKQALLGDVYESSRVVAEAYDESGTRLTVRGLPAAIARLRRAVEGRVDHGR
jgi:GTPase